MGSFDYNYLYNEMQYDNISEHINTEPNHLRLYKFDKPLTLIGNLLEIDLLYLNTNNNDWWKSIHSTYLLDLYPKNDNKNKKENIYHENLKNEIFIASDYYANPKEIPYSTNVNKYDDISLNINSNYLDENSGIIYNTDHTYSSERMQYFDYENNKLKNNNLSLFSVTKGL